ncbi:MAG TPA: hypothetical protein VJ865_12570 [Gemmatimonadaceae bacterium]|nr:hypothetical protein [Gemmatimonadaceae bacterium]
MRARGERREATGGYHRLLVCSMGFVLATCSPNPKALELRLWSDTYAFTVTADPTPPRALEQIAYRIVVQDKKTKQPIETGEGRIFATSPDRAGTNDGFKKEKELGTYSARLFFPTVGDWAAAIQFRRDSRLPLERVDWIQTVHPATEPGT